MLGFGIIGTNFISDWFVDACRRAGCEPVAVYSRTQSTGDDFAGRRGIAHAVDSLDALLALPGVDAVYVASPNGAHLEQSLAAFAAGKHVGNTAEFFCAVFADLQNAHAFLEVPNTERGRIAGGAGGRKNMVRAGTVVA